jgi:hypothetical protein
VVSLPHCEQLVRVSTRPELEPTGVAPRTDTRFALQDLHRLGSFLNCLSWKNKLLPGGENEIRFHSRYTSAPCPGIPLRMAPFGPSPRAHPAGTLAHAVVQRKVRLHPPSIYPWKITPGLGPPCPGKRTDYRLYTKKRENHDEFSRPPENGTRSETAGATPGRAALELANPALCEPFSGCACALKLL